MAPLSSRHADCHVVDYGGGAVHGHLPAAAVDRFPHLPARSEKLARPGVYLLVGSTSSTGSMSWKSMHYELLFTAV